MLMLAAAGSIRGSIKEAINASKSSSFRPMALMATSAGNSISVCVDMVMLTLDTKPVADATGRTYWK
jgi:hypothetical protein